jgi:two-component system chemotaxis sensor kinase CheA
MTADRSSSTEFSAAEMAELMAVYIDETGEQCDQLVAALLALEADPADARQIGIAFRMVHSIKGSAAMLGIDRVTTVAHHLESHFEKLRSGAVRLDHDTIQVALACVDYFRACNERLRVGDRLEGNGDLIDAVRGLATAPSRPAGRERLIRLRLAAGLELPDLKAELVLKRLAPHGTVVRTTPAVADLTARLTAQVLDVVVLAHADGAALVIAADVEGVDSVELDPPPTASEADPSPTVPTAQTPTPAPPPSPVITPEPVAPIAPALAEEAPLAGAAAAVPATTSESAATETMRVGVDRLDRLLDLAGELVVQRARFAQLVADLAPVIRQASLGSPEGQRTYGELVESVDHLARIVDNVQRGVLGTRMVPIGPLFGRFRRSVRDIAGELGKSVGLELVGEQTEIDKRMVDELGDPLVHLIRNAIDHGIEPSAVRAARGKPATATLRLEASHRGNEIEIAISDDGGGIDLERVRERAVSRGLVAADRAAALPPRELMEFIWQPGFSTAAAVSTISGRGVGMDIVRTKIEGLSGSVTVDSTPGVGTTFTIRLPLTLAISRCLLFRRGGTIFAIPVEHIREIVTVDEERVVSVAGRRVCHIRGEVLRLVDLREVFRWSADSFAAEPAAAVLVLRSGGRAVAVGVPAVLGTRDLVVKPLDENFRRIRGLGGASVLGDGEVCLLMDVAAMIDLATSDAASENHA